MSDGATKALITPRRDEHPLAPDPHRQIAVLPRDETLLRELAAAQRHAPGHVARAHRPERGSGERAASWTIFPPTSVRTARPVRVRPAKGVLRLFEKNAAGSTVHGAATSSTVTSAGAPGRSVPPPSGSRNTAAGTVLMRRSSSGSDSTLPSTSSVCPMPNAVSS